MSENYAGSRPPSPARPADGKRIKTAGNPHQTPLLRMACRAGGNRARNGNTQFCIPGMRCYPTGFERPIRNRENFRSGSQPSQHLGFWCESLKAGEPPAWKDYVRRAPGYVAGPFASAPIQTRRPIYASAGLYRKEEIKCIPAYEGARGLSNPASYRGKKPIKDRKRHRRRSPSAAWLLQYPCLTSELPLK